MFTNKAGDPNIFGITSGNKYFLTPYRGSGNEEDARTIRINEEDGLVYLGNWEGFERFGSLYLDCDYNTVSMFKIFLCLMLFNTLVYPQIVQSTEKQSDIQQRVISPSRPLSGFSR